MKKKSIRFEERTLEVLRVSKATKGGKKFSFRITVATGDRKGLIGIGMGKALTVPEARRKASAKSKKNMVKIPLTESLTIPHEIKAKFGAAKVFLKPASLGSGVLAGGATRIVLELAGVQSISAKQLGSKNLLNNAKATMKALSSLHNS